MVFKPPLSYVWFEIGPVLLYFVLEVGSGGSRVTIYRFTESEAQRAVSGREPGRAWITNISRERLRQDTGDLINPKFYMYSS